jgi:hypothetical protein
VGRVALGRLECAGPSVETAQLGPQPLELGDALIDLGRARPEEVEHVPAWGIALVAHGDDAADLAERQPDRLRGPHECQPVSGVLVVHAVARGRTGGWGEHTDLLVVADGLGRHPRLLRQLTDPQHPLDLPACWNLYATGVDIDLLHVPDCPNRAPTRRNLDVALADSGITARVREREVIDAAEAARVGMHGSPTVLIDGCDPFGRDGASLSCRLYRDATGVHGAPTVAQLVEALVS